MTLEFNKPPPAAPRRVRHIVARKVTGQKPALKMKEVWAPHQITVGPKDP